MKRIIYSPASLASLEAILRWTIEQFGDEQAERYTGQLTARLKALAQVTRYGQSLVRSWHKAAGMLRVSAIIAKAAIT